MTTSKIVLTLLTVATLTATPAAASAAPATPHIGQCGTWSCGANHNEVLATSERS